MKNLSILFSFVFLSLLLQGVSQAAFLIDTESVSNVGYSTYPYKDYKVGLWTYCEHMYLKDGSSFGSTGVSLAGSKDTRVETYKLDTPPYIVNWRLYSDDPIEPGSHALTVYKGEKSPPPSGCPSWDDFMQYDATLATDATFQFQVHPNTYFYASQKNCSNGVTTQVAEIVGANMGSADNIFASHQIFLDDKYSDASFEIMPPINWAAGTTNPVSSFPFGTRWTWRPNYIYFGVDFGVIPPGTYYQRIVSNGYSTVNTTGTLTLNCLTSPKVREITPEIGTGDATVTLIGERFGAFEGSVKIGGTSALITSWSDTAIVFEIPNTVAGGNRDIQVFAGGYASNITPFTVTPTIISRTPTSGIGGTEITVSGTNFGDSGNVSLGGVVATANDWSQTSFDINVPVNAPPGPQNISISTGGQTSNSVVFTISPHVNNLSPAVGPIWANFTIQGSNFGSSTGTVTVGGVFVTPSAWSNTSIEVYVPQLEVGAQNIVICEAGGSPICANTVAFTVLASSDSIAPGSGSGGTTVVMEGNFPAQTTPSPTCTVTLGGVVANIVSWSTTSIAFDIPNDVVAGVQSVAVSGCVTSTGLGSVDVIPTLSNMNPTSGVSGTAVTITGTNFGASQGANAATIGGISVTPAWSMQSLTFTVPSNTGSGSHNLIVTVGGMASNSTAFTVSPSITSLSASEGQSGASITIYGANFGTSGTLSLGGVSVSAYAWSMTAITFSVPNNLTAGSKSLVVSSSGQVSNAVTFTVNATVAAPQPATATGGTSISLAGSNLGNTQGTSTFTLGGVAITPDTWSQTGITFMVPNTIASGTLPVVISIAGQTLNASLVVTPTITSLSASSRAPGAPITLSGTNFGISGTVPFGTAQADTSGGWSATSIVAKVPALSPGVVNILVSTGGQSSNPVTFTVLNGLRIDERYPGFGTTSTNVSLTGQYFGATQGTVTIGGVSATIQGWTDTSIQFTIPSGVPVGINDIIAISHVGETSNLVPFSIRGSDVWIQLSDALHGRSEHTAVWTGREMIVWGGLNVSHGGSAGARYNISTDSWIPVVDNLSVPLTTKGVWTGTRMLVWDGTTGAKYDPQTGAWSSISTSGAPSARTHFSATWSGTEMIIWGGKDSTLAALNSGGKYNPQSDTWVSMTTTGAPTARYFHSVVWSGAELLVWGGNSNGTYLSSGGKYDPVNNIWVAMSSGGPSAREKASAVWADTKMIVWGGRKGTNQGDYMSSGSMYTPSTDSWMPITAMSPPNQRIEHSAVWTGSKMIIWGGLLVDQTLNDGKAYDPAGNTWSSITTTNAPGDRAKHSSSWTGTELLVWGGQASTQFGTQMLSSGGRYNLSTNTWVAIGGAPVINPRHGQSTVWSGSELLIWGGEDGFGEELETGARFDPATSTWQAMSNGPNRRSYHSAVWLPTVSKMLILGGGATKIYTPSTNEWSNAPNPADSTRVNAATVWTGTYAVVWGGYTNAVVNTGSKYNPTTNTWSTLTTSGAPTSRQRHTAVWTGTEMLVWGGEAYSTAMNTGGRYNVGSNTWTSMSTTNAPSARTMHSAVWSGTKMIVWGGTDGTTNSASGASYDPDPSANTWVTLSTTNAPSARHGHSAIWDGTEMVLFGGNGSQIQSDGYKYVSSTDTWSQISSIGTPTSRYLHDAVWTGTDMYVIGGTYDSDLDDVYLYIP